MQNTFFWLPILLLFGVFASVKAKKLTLPAAISAALLGVCLYAGAGFCGLLMAATLFLMATLATSHKAVIKEVSGAAESNKGQRKAGQVFANIGAAGFFGLLCFFYPTKVEMLRLMMAASLASAAADTISSELGTIYGTRFYNIINLKSDIKGLDGVISLEGTLFGLVASVIIAIIYAFGYSWNINFLLIIIAATIGNLIDSVLGATLERKRILDNNAVNFLNTIIAAFAALLMYFNL